MCTQKSKKHHSKNKTRFWSEGIRWGIVWSCHQFFGERIKMVILSIHVLTQPTWPLSNRFKTKWVEALTVIFQLLQVCKQSLGAWWTTCRSENQSCILFKAYPRRSDKASVCQQRVRVECSEHIDTVRKKAILLWFNGGCNAFPKNQRSQRRMTTHAVEQRKHSHPVSPPAIHATI